MFKGVNIAEFYTSSKKFATDQKCCYTLFITDIFFIKNSLKLHLPLCGLHNKEKTDCKFGFFNYNLYLCNRKSLQFLLHTRVLNQC